MSHQSLKDLVDVTGTPSDGQVLKYTAGSTSWEPADESGGGSSGAEYLELYEQNHGNSNYPLDYDDWPPDAAGEGDGYRTCPIYTGGWTHVYNNSLPTTSVDTKANLAGSYSFHSWFPNDMLFIKPSASDKYILDLKYVLYTSSSTLKVDKATLGLAETTYTGANPTPLQSYNAGSIKTLFSTTYNTIAYAGGSGWGYSWDRTGLIVEIEAHIPFSAHTTKVVTPSLFEFYGRSSGDIPGYMPQHSMWGDVNTAKLGIYERYVRLTKIA
tara:strand:+ start:437 stop:1243 length:807 start_codon:yes stop_codon:yes gene_type:complete